MIPLPSVCHILISPPGTDIFNVQVENMFFVFFPLVSRKLGKYRSSSREIALKAIYRLSRGQNCSFSWTKKNNFTYAAAWFLGFCRVDAAKHLKAIV